MNWLTIKWSLLVTISFLFMVLFSACSAPVPTATPTIESPTSVPDQPTLQAIYPADAALPGAIVTLAGVHFGESPGKVMFGDHEGQIMGWEDRQIDVEVPVELVAGKINITVQTSGGADSGESTSMLSFTVLEPSLSSLGLRVTGVYQAAVADYDLDGDLDMFVPSNYSEDGIDNAYFLNNGNATFSEVSLEEAGFPLQADSFTAVTADFDRDGDADLYVAGSGQDLYALNNGDGTFNLQNLAEVGLEMHPDQNGTEKLGIAVADYDLDGSLDVFVNIGFSEQIDNFYALNNGDGTFTAVDLAEAGIPAGGDGKYVSAADFNGDGAPDLWIGQVDSTVVYLLNNGDGSFSQRDPVTIGIVEVGAGSQQSVADFDLDDDLDLFLGDTEPADNFASLQYFAQNNGDGSFSIVDLEEIGLLDSPHQFRGTVAADFNGDGYADIYQSGSFAPDGLFAINNGDGTFRQVDLAAIGLGSKIALGLPVAADFDGDGDLDIFNHAIFARNQGDGTFITYR